jgi:PAS domain-containing protein
MKDKKKTKHKPYVSSPDESMFRIMAEKSPNMIFVNKGGRVIYANEKCEEIMGYSKEEFYSPDFYFRVPGRAHSLGGGSPLQARQGELLAGRQGYSP